MGRISRGAKLIFQAWGDYLARHIFQVTIFTNLTIPAHLYSLFPYRSELPSIYNQILETPFEDWLELIKEPSKVFFKRFREDFSLNFALFSKNIEYLGEELARIDKVERYSNVKDILQLKNDNEPPTARTPIYPDVDLNKLILNSIHIRNAIAHNNYKVEDKSITLWDFDRNNNKTWEESFSNNDLYSYQYYLHILNSGIEKVSLRFLIEMELETYLERKEKSTIMCEYCHYVNIQIIKVYNPNRCERCKSALLIPPNILQEIRTMYLEAIITVYQDIETEFSKANLPNVFGAFPHILKRVKLDFEKEIPVILDLFKLERLGDLPIEKREIFQGKLLGIFILNKMYL
jgi:hypothetical protein